MTFAFIASAKANGASGGTTSAIDTTGAKLLVLHVGYSGAISVSDSKGNTWTAGTAASATASSRFYYCLSPTVGAGHTFTVSASVSSIVASAWSCAGTAVLDSQSTGNSTSGTQGQIGATTFTPTTNNCLVIAGATFESPGYTSGFAAGSGWTLVDVQNYVGGTNYGASQTYKVQTTATAIPTSQATSTWTGSVGFVYTGIAFSEGASDSITITNPVQYKVFQRSGSTGSIAITGTYTGTPTAIEASFNGGAYSTIVASPAGGTFTGTLSGQTQGQGVLTVRFTNNTSASATKADIGIGDVFVVGGDSISEGRGTNAQSFSHATLKAAKFTQANAWGLGNDGIDTGTSAGSHWPLLATQIMASQSVPVAFISVGTGGTDVSGSNNTWARPGSEYTGLTTQVTGSGVNSVKGVLFHLGPNAVVNASTLAQATYNAAVDTLASNIAADVAGSPKICVGLFGQVTTGSPPDRRSAIDNIRAAIIEAQGDNTNVKPGPNLIDLSYADGVHPISDSDLATVAKRWWVALSETYYGGTGGRGPRVSSASWNGARTQLTVAFDRNLKTGLTFSTAPWIVKDNGSTMTVSSVAYHGTNAAAIVIATSAAATGGAGTTTLTFASSNDAAGLVVPLSADITMPSGAAIQIPAEPFYVYQVSELDTTAPTLSGAVGSQLTSTTADCSVTTNEGNGTLYLVVSTSSTPPAVAGAGGFVAGSYAYSGSTIVSSTGTKTITATGLTPSTVYYAHFQHTDAAGNKSSVVTSASFQTTAASGALTTAEQREMYDYVIALAKIHGLVVGSPMTVSTTSRTAGGVAQTISDASGTVTVTRTS